MPAPINEIIKRRVIQQCLDGEARDKIASNLQIGEGTVSNIVSEFKIGLENSEFEAARELALQAKKLGLNLSGLASNYRLYNLVRSGAAEDKIESFIDNVNFSNLPSKKFVELVYQLNEISKTESIPLDQVPGYIKQKLEEKQKIDEEIKEADSILQSKNVNIEAINEHIELNEELEKYTLSTKDIHKLLNLLLAAKGYKYSPGKIIGKLRSIKGLENKESKLKNSCEILSTKEAKYKEIIPLANLIWDLHIRKNELISFKIAVNETAETYGINHSAAALDVINLVIDHNKKGQLKRELSELTLQKYAIDRFCSSRSQVITSLVKVQSRGITEDQIIHMNKFLEDKGYKSTAASFK